MCTYQFLHRSNPMRSLHLLGAYGTCTLCLRSITWIEHTHAAPTREVHTRFRTPLSTYHSKGTLTCFTSFLIKNPENQYSTRDYITSTDFQHGLKKDKFLVLCIVSQVSTRVNKLEYPNRVVWIVGTLPATTVCTQKTPARPDWKPVSITCQQLREAKGFAL